MTELTLQSPRNASQKGDLTSQWKKGKLPEGWYYGKIGNNNYILSTWKGVKNYIQLKNKDGEVFIREMDDCKVIAEVPDYVEWRNMVNCACEEHEANKRLIEENDNLKKIIGYMIDEVVDRKNGASLVDYFSHDLIDEIMEALK